MSKIKLALLIVVFIIVVGLTFYVIYKNFLIGLPMFAPKLKVGEEIIPLTPEKKAEPFKLEIPKFEEFRGYKKEEIKPGIKGRPNPFLPF